MTDFYTLLKQSLIDRGIKDPTDRVEVYAQARRAIVKQLWDFRPPLAADEIDTRVGAYDTAVERIEADLLVAFANGARPQSSRKLTPAPEPEPSEPEDSPPLAEWSHLDEPDDEPEYAPGVERASTAQARQAEALVEEYYDDEQPPAYAAPSDRWTERHPYEESSQPETWLPSWGLKWLGSGEQTKVRLLGIAIGVLFIVLVGIGAYFIGSRGDRSVTLGIGVRREVSDAATAARIPTDRLQVTQTFALFDGRDPTIFVTSPDNPIRFDSAGGFARVSSSSSSPGVKVLVGPGLAAKLAGQRVRVTIVSRSSVESGAAGMRFAYQSGLAISHWQTANLGTDYEPVGMVWRVPTMRTNPNGDYLLIEPGIPGDGTGADIQSIKIEVVAS